MGCGYPGLAVNSTMVEGTQTYSPEFVKAQSSNNKDSTSLAGSLLELDQDTNSTANSLTDTLVFEDSLNSVQSLVSKAEAIKIKLSTLPIERPRETLIHVMDYDNSKFLIKSWNAQNSMYMIYRYIDGKALKKWKATSIKTTNMMQSRRGRLIAYNGDAVEIWNICKGTCEKVLHTSPTFMCEDQLGILMIWNSLQSQLQLWNSASEDVLKFGFSLAPFAKETVRGLLVSTKNLVVVCDECIALIPRSTAMDFMQGNTHKIRTGKGNTVQGFSLLSDNEIFLLHSKSGKRCINPILSVWDVNKRKLVKSIMLPNEIIQVLSIENGNLLILDKNRQLSLWNSITGDYSDLKTPLNGTLKGLTMRTCGTSKALVQWFSD
jgi:hypothetical protein